MLLQSQVPNTSGKMWSKEGLALLAEYEVMEHLNWTYTSTWDLVGCIRKC